MATGNLGQASFTVTAEVRPFEAGMKKAQADAKRSAQVLDFELGRAAGRAKGHLDSLAKSSGRFGQGLLQLSNIVDDAQYGFRSVVNNLAPAITMFGGSAGLAAGVTVASVAVNQLVNRWGELMDMMKSAWLNVPADRLEKLRIRAEKASEAFDKLANAPSKVEEKQIDVLTDVMRGADKGGQAMAIKGVREAIAQEPGMRPELGPQDAIEIARRMAVKAAKNAWQLKAGVGAEQLKKQVMEEMIRERLDEAVRQLIGQALLPGEIGSGARANLGRLIEKYKDSFTEKFRKAFLGADIESVGNADANRAAAAGLMGTSLGMRVLAAGGPAGPASRGQLEALMKRGSNRRFDKLGKQFVDRMLAAGLTEDQAREVMGGLGRKEVFERSKTIAAGIGVRPGPHGTFPGEVAEQAAKDIFKARLEAAKAGGGKPDAIDKEIEGRLRAAGIEGDAPGVRREMRKMNEDRIKAVMMEQGVNKQQAQFLVAREQSMKRFPGLNNPGQWVGAAEFRRMTTGGLPDQLPDLATKQLRELMDIRRVLQEMARKAAPAAVAGP